MFKTVAVAEVPLPVEMEQLDAIEECDEDVSDEEEEEEEEVVNEEQVKIASSV